MAGELNLLKGEEVLLVTRPTLKQLAVSLIIRFVILLLGMMCIIHIGDLFMIGCLLSTYGLLTLVIGGLIKLVKLCSFEYTITNKRILAKRGIISVNMEEVRIADVRSVSMQKTILGRLMNYGSVEVGTAATSDTEILLSKVDNPEEVVNLINENRIV